MSDEITAANDSAAENAAAPAPEEAAPKPRRRTRKAPTDAAPAEGAEAAPAPAKPKRARARKAAASEPAEGVAAAPLSPEVAQARALAQVSQASVVRRQRRAAAAAEEMLAASDAAAPAAEDVPLVDPALRPHRRGRKPKAYVEAERAARAAAQALESGAAPAPAEAPAAAEPVQAPLFDAESAAPAAPAEGDAAPKGEKRPKRTRRSRKATSDAASADAAPAEAPAAPDAEGASADGARPASEAPVEQPAASDAAKSEGASKKDGVSDRESGRARRVHVGRKGERNAGAERAGNDEHRARDRQDRSRSNRKQQRNNRYNVPSEPTLSHEELAAMKVAELREKARELDIDVAGKKKAELVEEVYQVAARAEGFRDVDGILDISSEGFGHLRVHGYSPSRDDAFVPANLIRAARLRAGDHITGTCRPSRANDKYPGLAKIKTVNGRDPEEMRNRPKFSDLTPIYPNEPLRMEHGKDSITGRAIDIVAPVGKGQRGLIVSPPKAGKTTILKKICQAISINNPEVHVICLLVDERPEEVTDMQRSIKGEVVASTFDMPADNHTRVAELVIERAKRIVELGGDVVVVLDSITRLARAYNLAAPASGRILSGGVDSAALYPPKRFLGAARNIENGGSLTILASALVDTGSKMDEVIFEEFKGTGNMELKLDRDLADRRIFPAIDPVASGTRNEDLLIDEQMRPFVWGIRRVLASMNNTERSASAFIKGLRSTNSNREFLIRSAKRAQEHGDV